jgi:hypothetical protein
MPWEADAVGSRPHGKESRRTLQLAARRALPNSRRAAQDRFHKLFIAATVIPA